MIKLFATTMNTRVEFKSSAFPKYENEDEETVNPNRWGKRLAEFVRDNLPSYGVGTQDILCEDWGWLVNTKNDEFPVWIGCGPLDDFADGDDEADPSPASQASSSDLTEFCVFVTAEPSFFKKLFKRIDTAPAVAKVVEALEKMIADREEFQDAEWSE
ncbi:MAG: hypothetical protein ACKV19_16215 [Verrucomicrobiales bacterium]